MGTAKILGLARLKARLAQIPTAVAVAAGSQLAQEAEDLTEAIQRQAPVSELEETPGALRDSVHFFPTPDRPLSYRILADAKDEGGEPIGSHVEHGHRAADGSHVAAQPFFFAVYRARKRAIRRRLNAAARKAIRQIFPR